MAAGGAAAPSVAAPLPDAAWWLGGFITLLMIASLIVGIYNGLKPKPPFWRQFAAIDHTHTDLAPLDHSHSNLLTIPSHEEQTRSSAKDRLTLRQGITTATEKMENQVDGLRDAIRSQGEAVMSRLDKLDERNEERIGHVYDTIKPLAPAISANKALIDNHLAEHRSSKGAS